MGEGLRYEIGEFLFRINCGVKDDFKLTRGESIALADIMEQFMREMRGA